ncbi:nuclease-like protein [Bacillus oleivorans]|uniref:Nuclease-like protein n=1 Tax=Bacillus oleivorans TaxID=1448271 RepID=A0A285CQ53_9BACI|nr:nuclease-related domain-containing protein [Bacillus oleivorans]SNX69677.1 nuclease-like protein [Bacillus oleivorans]
MFIKIREKSIKLIKEDALLALLPEFHKKRPEILRNSQKGWAGYRGEKELDYHLTFLPDTFTIIPDLRIPINDTFFQIDTLILCPYFTLIIESKNIFGSLYFEPDSNQVIRTFNQQDDGFPNPILQAKRQMKQFKRWISANFNKEIPCYYMVSIGSPRTIVKGPRSIFQYVQHAEHIPDKVESLLKNETNPYITPYLLKKISSLLLKENTPLEFDALNYYQLNKEDLMRGITCSKCNQAILQRTHKYWRCSSCDFYSNEIHIKYIENYLNLFNTITTKDCESLIGISSRFTIRRILLDMGLKPNKQRPPPIQKTPRRLIRRVLPF